MDNKKRFFLLIILAGFIISFFAGYTTGSHPVANLTEVAPSDNGNTKIAVLQQTIDQLRSENVELTHQLNVQRNKKPADTFAPNSMSNLPGPVDDSDSGNWEAISRIQDINKSLQEKIKNNRHYDYAADLAQRFDDEPIDVGWANKQQEAVTHFFRDVPALANVVPESITCKMERCRIRVPAANVDEANRIGLAFSQAISTHNDYKALSVAAALDKEKGLVDIYLPKNQHVILFN